MAECRVVDLRFERSLGRDLPEALCYVLEHDTISSA